MAEAIVSDIVVKLLELMCEDVLEVIAPYFGGRRKLKELNKTMIMIQARLLDAERLRECENRILIKEWLRRLKHLLYRMEDLFEEVVIADKEYDHMSKGKLMKSSCLLFSKSSPFMISKKVAQEVKAIMEELQGITSDMLSLNLRVHSVEDHCAINLTIRRETHSFIREEEVVGRENDKKELIDKILHCDDVRGNISVIPVVGIGGLGKTTLAQLVFNDEIVRKSFEVIGWVSVSQISSVEELVRKIVTSISNIDIQQLNMEQLQTCLREAVSDRKYLLVLDDIWDEDRERWLSLKRLLWDGKQGSKIIVTSRSKVVALNMGTTESYCLKGLSDDKSWELFRSLAFKEGQEEITSNLISIGKEIIKKCANVPLAIRTIAGLLYSKDTETEWESFKDRELGVIGTNEDNVMSTLKLSYDHLPPQLKHCFAYCSLFPKNCTLEKQHLIYLWIAQGFIRPTGGSQRLEDLGHAYFMELLRRSFFHYDVKGDNGEIISCKMHALIHDLAQQVAGGDSLLLCARTQHVDDRILHVSLMVGRSWEAPSMLLAAKRVRSLLLLSYTTVLNVNEIFSSFCFLRALDLVDVGCESLPNSIGKLKHLRYLRLGFSIVSLPDNITMLQNLQTLDLTQCCCLKQLPTGFGELINLRHLRNRSCEWIDMCPGFGKIMSLDTLDVFAVGEITGLNALAGWDNLGGKLEIRFHIRRTEAVSEAATANLKRKKLTHLVLSWLPSYGDSTAHDDKRVDDKVLECLQLPHSLKCLQILKWKGVKLPRWGMDELLNLVSLELLSCRSCQYLPSFSRLPHLRYLSIKQLEALEYFDIEGTSSVAPYFPSLELLELHYMYKLRGWFMDDDVCGPKIREHRHFPRLSELQIANCPKLTSIPHVPKLEKLWAQGINGKLLKHVLCGGGKSPTTSSTPSSAVCTLRSVLIDGAHELDSLSFINQFSLETLGIHHCDGLINLTVESLTSLRTLCITGCYQLRDITEILLHLSVLEELEIAYCNELSLKDNVDDDGKSDESNRVINSSSSWEVLKSLCCLKLYDLWKLESLPRGLGFLTALQELRIIDVPNLTTLPEQIAHLTQLRRLFIRGCRKLTALPDGMGHLTQLLELDIEYLTELVALPEWIGHLTQLRRLKVDRCLKLTGLPEQMGQLTRLHELYIQNCPELTALLDGIGKLTQLRKLSIENCPKLDGLPMGIGYLPQLFQLSICGCHELSSLPESFCKLTALNQLYIQGCPELVARCQRPDGEYWPIIQQIPFVFTSALARLKS